MNRSKKNKMKAIRDKFRLKKSYEQVELRDGDEDDFDDEENDTNNNNDDNNNNNGGFEHIGVAARLEEAKRLLTFFTVRQKIRMLSGLDMWHLKPIPSLKIPPLWICDGPHGLRKQTFQGSNAATNTMDLVQGRVAATCFPTASALASSWNRSLLHDVGRCLARDCIAENVSIVLGPGINIIRTPLGGRNFEYFSEDPLLTGHLASSLIQGIQSQGVAACAKHFCANNQETNRWVTDVIVDERTLREIYWKAWEIVVKQPHPSQQPWTIMCAYNKVNGLYCSENRVLNNRILRDEWGYQGVVMTDWGATNNRWKGIAAGVDLEMPGSQGAHDYGIMEAYYDERLSERQLDECAARVLALQLVGVDVGREAVRTMVDEHGHHQCAYRAAVESCVLLKNQNGLLPLKPGTSLAVIGNFAAFPRYQGMGSSQVLPTKVDAAFDRFQDHTLKIHGVQGYTETDNDILRRALLEEAVDAARENDVAIVFLGLLDGDETEGMDRQHLDLPVVQEILLEKILEVNPRTVVVLTNGSPITMPWEAHVPAILEGWLAGQAGGSAIADIIFGEAEPSGKLAQTFPLSLDDVPSHAWQPNESTRQVQYREAMHVGYRYYNSAYKAVLFPFGHGLTYTTFDYSGLVVRVLKDEPDDTQVSVSVTIRNTGDRVGSEIVQCYVYDGERTLYRPYHELKNFEKITLKPYESQTVWLDLDRDAFTFYDVGTRQWLLEPGSFEVQIGASSRDIRLKAALTLQGTGEVPSNFARMAHPNKAFPVDRVPDSDTEFAAMLGYDIPVPPPPSGYFDYNTLLKELQTCTVGRKVFAYVERTTTNPSLSPVQRHVQRIMMETMPLRGLVVFSRGMLTFDILDLLLSLMNGEYAYTKALCMAPPMILSWLIMKCFGVNNRV